MRTVNKSTKPLPRGWRTVQAGVLIIAMIGAALAMSRVSPLCGEWHARYAITPNSTARHGGAHP
jgi:hypothetical protein